MEHEATSLESQRADQQHNGQAEPTATAEVTTIAAAAARRVGMPTPRVRIKRTMGTTAARGRSTAARIFVDPSALQLPHRALVFLIHHEVGHLIEEHTAWRSRARVVAPLFLAALTGFVLVAVLVLWARVPMLVAPGLGTVAVGLCGIGGLLAAMKRSRQLEHAADAFAAHTAPPLDEESRAALIQLQPEAKFAWLDLFATHPAWSDRMKRIVETD